LSLADRALSEGRIWNASTYYRTAEFYMGPADPGRREVWDKSVKLFRQYAAPDFDSGRVVETKIPYENGFLPAWRFPAGKSLGAVVLHGGFDSCLEELYPAASLVRDQGYEFIMFEGPGQGSALKTYGLPMTHEWEKPVSAVLDHFGLSDVTLIGLSLGGYLAPRASAFIPRIKRVVAWDVLYDFLDLLARGTGSAAVAKTLKMLVRLRAAPLINAFARVKMEKDVGAKWAINNGMFVMGAKTPYGFFRRAKKYNMKKISRLVTQDFLLLAGAEDHFIGLDQYHKQARALTEVRSFTGRIFTRAEHAEAHCQMGNIPLALLFIMDWIKERMEVDGRIREILETAS
jgi:pimeloyl-ACP methyl ester carboxylesterase